MSGLAGWILVYWFVAIGYAGVLLFSVCFVVNAYVLLFYLSVLIYLRTVCDICLIVLFYSLFVAVCFS